ncbi:hypothetical protein CGRA01v4_00185 [Colletotrichum graminicola]|nr:hypothetical protein CGRA01v4_00185 [Colletotrichum graminicola]
MRQVRERDASKLKYLAFWIEVSPALFFLASATPAPLKQHRPAALPTHHCMTCIPWACTLFA